MMKTKTALTILALAGLFIISSIELKAQEVATGYVEAVELLEHDTHWDDVYISSGRRSNERNSRLTLSKRYDGETVSKKGVFSVESTTTKFRLSIDGSVKSGTIKVTVLLPDGKAFKTINIDDTADIHWSESINIKEGENKYHGDWKYEISTASAKGSYHLSLATY
jgi:hypothetical protein